MSNSVSIYLTRSDNSKSDDVIVITPRKNSLVVKYTDRLAVTDVKRTKLVLPKDGLVSYIQNMAYLFMVDTDPFKNMQLNFPGFPVFMVSPTSLKSVDTQDAIMHTASIVTQSWYADQEDEDLPRVSDVTPTCDPVYQQAYQQAYDRLMQAEAQEAQARAQQTENEERCARNGCDYSSFCDDCEELPPLVDANDDIWRTPSRPTRSRASTTNPPRLSRSERMTHRFW